MDFILLARHMFPCTLYVHRLKSQQPSLTASPPPLRGELWEAEDGGECGGLVMSLIVQSKQQEGGNRMRKRAGERQPRYRRGESLSRIPLPFFFS